MKKIIYVLLLLLISSSINSQWVQVSSEMGNNQYSWSIAILGSEIFVGTDGSGIFKSTNYVSNWTLVNNGLSNQFVKSLLASGSNIYAATNGGVFLSSNNGLSWTAVNSGLTNLFVWALAISGTNLFAGTNGGVFLSTNNGANWSSVSSGLISPYIRSFTYTGNNIFTGTSDHGIFLTTNNGTNWYVATSGISNNAVFALAASGTNIYAGTYGGGIFLSSNNGTNWVASNNGLMNNYVRTIYINGTNIFVGTDSGAYLSTNGGALWIRKNQGFSSIPSCRSFGLLNNYIFVATDGHSIWRRVYSETIGVQNISSEIPSSFKLKQNYPNPFNPTTNIRFDVVKESYISLKVFDIRGELVETLVYEKLAPGTYQTSWNASQYASGVYFYKIIANGFVETNRMLYLK